MENTRRMFLSESAKNTDDAVIKGTKIKILQEGTDIVLFEELHNKVIIAGSAFTAGKHFAIKPPIKLPTYNTVLGLENSVTVSEPETIEKVCLFAMGTDGCGVENSQVYDVDYTKWIKPEFLIPFRYQLPAQDITTIMRESYFGRKIMPDTRLAYYFKAFDSEPVMFQQRIDGTPIDAGIYDEVNSMAAQTFVELRLKITKEDGRDFFISTTNINDAKVNTISLLTAWKKTTNGFTYYQDIQPLTKLNIPNEPLIDLTKGIDIIYHIYY